MDDSPLRDVQTATSSANKPQITIQLRSDIEPVLVDAEASDHADRMARLPTGVNDQPPDGHSS